MFRDSQVSKGAWIRKKSKQDYQLLAYLIPINSWYLLQEGLPSLYLNVTAIEISEVTHILVHITRTKLRIEFNTPILNILL